MIATFRGTATRDAATPRAPAVAAVTPPATPMNPSDATVSSASDPVWALLGAAASEIELGDAHDAGLVVGPASVDTAVANLTAGERSELERLIRAELKRSGA
jgi:hypothetical protein